ncbi:hypothetical protein CHLNCDRAFT_135791 [Chlorella variabilis]|uniref:GST C-terminal domain-containing protein n=1 Tax=Chlorella variabilis TaxID=554065 RepID=E1ZJ04_CHLVA|nr:hypothetical protein CHLNCDRAFT_135791 [Chlorella variabilis]EFN54422.1 hypothetical protein CHLNCDRAFT_135791 [Chlorella variabilis]|eukprot:XP_005846524.1 hypothetical protein CHLNCDRAFT_135791 [Chlorella variabilis]
MVDHEVIACGLRFRLRTASEPSAIDGTITFQQAAAMWKFMETGPHQGDIFAQVVDYANPQDAPERLLPHSHPPACGVPPGRALEAALLTGLAGVLLACLYSLLVLRRRRVPDTPAAAEDPSAPIVLADFPRLKREGGPTCSPSSAVTKAEAFLRFAGIHYSKQVGSPDPAPSPGVQLPYLDRGPRQRVADPHFIIKHLVSSGAAPAELEFPPGARDRAAAIAVARMCDTDLAGAVDFYRWVDDEGWARCRQALMGPSRPLSPLGAVLSRMARKACYTRCWEEGIGAHSEGDRLALVGEELGALSQLLGDSPYLFGASPHAVDAAAFGVLDQMAARCLNPQLADLLERWPNLAAYRDRIRRRFFGQEYERVVAWVDDEEGAAASSGQGGAAGGGAEQLGGGGKAAHAAAAKLRRRALVKEE